MKVSIAHYRDDPSVGVTVSWEGSDETQCDVVVNAIANLLISLGFHPSSVADAMGAYADERGEVSKC